MSEINCEFVASLIEKHNTSHSAAISYSELVANLRNTTIGDRPLDAKEKEVVTSCIRDSWVRSAAYVRDNDTFYSSCASNGGAAKARESDSECGVNSKDFRQILIVTAYSSDYNIGHICSDINRRYAMKHGYEFESQVLPLSDMTDIIAPKKHCAWYKILMIKQLMQRKEQLYSRGIQYIMWIDADAIIIDHEVSLHDFVTTNGLEKDLIIAEDMNSGCLLNTGIFLLRMTNWSNEFINSIWSSDRYNDVTFYEQSTMVRNLRGMNEGLESVKPFHSFVKGGSNQIKQFAHVAVFPCRELNTNKGISPSELLKFTAAYRIQQCEERQRLKEQHGGAPDRAMTDDCICTYTNSSINSNSSNNGDKANAEISLASMELPSVSNGHRSEQDARFVYHVAGLSNKLNFIVAAICKYDLPCNIQLLRDAKPFRLVRGKNGQILTEEVLRSRNLVL